MRIKMKKRLHRYGIKRPRYQGMDVNIVNIKQCLSIMIYYATPKKQLKLNA